MIIPKNKAKNCRGKMSGKTARDKGIALLYGAEGNRQRWNIRWGQCRRTKGNMEDIQRTI
jgi:hypothetical protein